MKRIIITSLLSAFMLNASAQIATFDNMCRKLETFMHDGVWKSIANSGRFQIETTVAVSINPHEFCSKSTCGEGSDYIDSLILNSKVDPNVVAVQNKERLLSYVRSALDSIMAMPGVLDSYHFETHQQGIDTIRYSICLNRGPEHRVTYDSIRGCEVYSRELGPETITFNYETHKKPCAKHFWGMGSVEYTRVEPLPASLVPSTAEKYESISFDWDLYLQGILPFLNQKGISQRKFKWSQDDDYVKNLKDPNIDHVLAFWNYKSENEWSAAGETDGTLYFIPADQKTLAYQVLKDINDASLNYVLCHPEQTYDYHYNTSFNYPNYSLGYRQQILRSTTWGKDGRQNFVYVGADVKGYYFLLLSTKGSLWFPREYASLKSYINGEKVYIKGMEPKEDKK